MKKEFVEKNYITSGLPIVTYFDMDGVLVDFCGSIKPIFGLDVNDNQSLYKFIEKPDEDKMKETILNTKDFWFNLIPIDENLKFFKYSVEMAKFFPNINIRVLTSIGSNNSNAYAEKAMEGKLKWFNKHLKSTDIDIPLIFEKNKYIHAKSSKYNILIDDYKKNCDAWKNYGGTALFIDNKDELKENLVHE